MQWPLTMNALCNKQLRIVEITYIFVHDHSIQTMIDGCQYHIAHECMWLVLCCVARLLTVYSCYCVLYNWTMFSLLIFLYIVWIYLLVFFVLCHPCLVFGLQHVLNKLKKVFIVPYPDYGNTHLPTMGFSWCYSCFSWKHGQKY